MGITADFLIKHVRPHGTDSMDTILLDGALEGWLLAQNVSEEEISIAFANWKNTSNLENNSENEQKFIDTAKLISSARWDELYQTSKSTILFLNGPLIKELSYRSEQNKGKKFEFNPYEYIPLAVTIHKDGGYQVHRNVEGAIVVSDENGNCCHLEGLIN